MTVSEDFQLGADFARALDAGDPLARFRGRFAALSGRIYLQANGLGLASREAEAAVEAALAAWKPRAHRGWAEGEQPWLTTAERLGALQAPLVGAAADEVVATGTATQNLHVLLATFYRPAGRRTKILADELNFPSDVFALQSQVRLRGLDPAEHLVLVKSRDGRMLEEDDVVAAMTDEITVLVLPSAIYRSAQVLDVARLTRAAHERGILAGFDLSHSIGITPHALDRWDVDFAFWCGYKWLNGGPGAVGGLYVNRRHFGRRAGMTGWFGVAPARQFDPDLVVRAGAHRARVVPVDTARPPRSKARSASSTRHPARQPRARHGVRHRRAQHRRAARTLRARRGAGTRPRAGRRRARRRRARSARGRGLPRWLSRC